MTPHPFTDPPHGAEHEALEEGGTRLLDLVAAVDHLRRGYRPQLTVWDALAEATLWWNDPTGDDPLPSRNDPLADGLRQLADTATPTAAAALQVAVRRWTTTMANRYNAGYHWPHPEPRRGFPPPAIDSDP
jgi:hypothetical protein